MAKLSNGVINSNTNFPDAFAEYLLTALYTCVLNGNNLHFRKNRIEIVVYNNHVDIFEFEPHPTDPQWSFKINIPEINSLNVIDFSTFLSNNNILPIDVFLACAKRQGKQRGIEAMMIADQNINSFKTA